MTTDPDCLLDSLGAEIERVSGIRERTRSIAQTMHAMGYFRDELYRMDQAVWAARMAKEEGVDKQEAALEALRGFPDD